MGRPFGSPQQLEKRRWRALDLLKSGWRAQKVAAAIGCARSAVYAWQESFRRKGKKALQSKPIPGRPPKLDARQKKKLTRVLLAGALNYGYSQDLWTQARVAKVIEKEFGVSYHPNHLWRFLIQTLGWSCQKPEKRALERNDEAIARWNRYKFPHIKKGRTTWGPSRLPR